MADNVHSTFFMGVALYHSQQSSLFASILLVDKSKRAIYPCRTCIYRTQCTIISFEKKPEVAMADNVLMGLCMLIVRSAYAIPSYSTNYLLGYFLLCWHLVKSSKLLHPSLMTIFFNCS